MQTRVIATASLPHSDHGSAIIPTATRTFLALLSGFGQLYLLSQINSVRIANSLFIGTLDTCIKSAIAIILTGISPQGRTFLYPDFGRMFLLATIGFSLNDIARSVLAPQQITFVRSKLPVLAF